MKTILVDQKGFTCEADIDESKDHYVLFERPRYELYSVDSFDPSEVVTVTKSTFYYKRSFFNELGERVRVFEERL